MKDNFPLHLAGLKILCQTWQQILFNVNWQGDKAKLNLTVITIMDNLLTRSEKLRGQLGKTRFPASIMLIYITFYQLTLSCQVSMSHHLIIC